MPDHATIAAFIKDNDPRPGKRGREIQSNITDNESAKLKSSHGMLQSYNGIVLVDGMHQLIVTAGAHGVGQEYNLLQPTLEQFSTCPTRLA